MYGLLLQNMAEYVVKVYGDKKWKEIKDALKIQQVLIDHLLYADIL